MSIGLFSGTVLNVRKHIFERKHRNSFRNFSSIVNKYSLVIGCNKSMIRRFVICEFIVIVQLNSPILEIPDPHPGGFLLLNLTRLD